jgi:hypothetical protein
MSKTGSSNEPTNVYNINLPWHSVGGEIVTYNTGNLSGRL